MPCLHFEHTLVPLLSSQRRLKTIHYQALYLLFKNAACHIPLDPLPPSDSTQMCLVMLPHI